VTVLNQTPSAFRQLVTAQGESTEVHQLRQVIFGGEALEVATLRPWYEQNEGQDTRLVNMYGITETTVHVTYRPLERADTDRRGASPIGRRIPDLSVYLLDPQGGLVPVGVAGEIHVGGAGVARGYLNRLELTAERFVPDPFGGVPGGRLFRTGDLGRYLPDGDIEFLGRNDFQVKIRGFRIELGEIETVLAGHPGVGEAVVLAREDSPGDKRLVGYYTLAPISGEAGEADEPEVGVCAEVLRAYLLVSLPEYMVPAAFVVLAGLPLTANGKLDRGALPAPDGGAFVVRGYEAPQGEVETVLAGIWAELLGVERVGRGDNFFELGGHSLLAVTLVGRMRQVGLNADVRALFVAPTLAALAAEVGGASGMVEVPANLIPPGCALITPQMLPLVGLSAQEIGRVVAAVPGGVANVADIYPLGPLQEGILFHHMMVTGGDPYLLPAVFGFDSRGRLDEFLSALQAVVDRHDILRTAFLWEGLPEPVQVVLREAPLVVEEVSFDPAAGDICGQLLGRFDPRVYRLDVRRAPLMRVVIARDDPNSRWVMLYLFHHLVMDHTTLEVLQEEVQAHLLGRGGLLPAPLPYRNFVAQARLGVSREEHEGFFGDLLGDVDEPTTPFGLADVQGDGSGIGEARVELGGDLARRMRVNARSLGVSAASLCHLAWAQVLGRVSGREDVVFGTV
jgi:aryl carrier-like protein